MRRLQGARHGWLCAAVLAVALPTGGAEADELCRGCRLSLPPGTEPVPLIVTLHGDNQAVATIHEAWTRLGKARGIGVLSLMCPTELGCKRSYWRWNGSPSWVDEQVRSVEATRKLDRERLWLVGWSGGASYIGMRAPAFGARFAAIVIHGGGMAPAASACSADQPPVYFLVGDKNPLHFLAVMLRDYHVGCGARVTWELLPGADHEGEWSALATHGGAIITWLLAHPRAAAASRK